MATDKELLDMDYRNELFLWYYHQLGSIKKLISLQNEYIRKFGFKEAIEFKYRVIKEISTQQRKDDTDEQAQRHRKTIQHHRKLRIGKDNHKRNGTEQSKGFVHRQTRKKSH